MPFHPTLNPSTQEMLSLARRDKTAAEAQMARESLASQVQQVCEAPAARRLELLQLCPKPELVIPQLPEAELCFAIKAVSLNDAAWILEYATTEQFVTCIDLDIWKDQLPQPLLLREWLSTCVEAGETTLLRMAKSLDTELLFLFLRDRLETFLKPEDDSWSPPEQSQTLDGQFYYRARREGDDLAEITRLFDALFREDYWLYFRLFQSVIWEPEAENQEWALRWHVGRLQDLGFPPREEAIRIMAILTPEEFTRVPDTLLNADDPAWRLPVWLPSLPAELEERYPLLATAADLSEEARKLFFYQFIALTNNLAVVDELPLSDTESIPIALEKAAGIAGNGMAFLAEKNQLSPLEVLQRVSLQRLFRVGYQVQLLEKAALQLPEDSPEQENPQEN